MADETRVVLVKPGDVLVFGNVGALGDPAAMQSAIAGLKAALGFDRVVVFEADIDIALVEMQDAINQTAAKLEAIRNG